MALVANCLPRVIKVDSACGCTLTATSIRGLTPGELEALQMKEIDLARVILNAAEAKTLGVKESGLATLLRSTIKNIKPSLGQTKIDEQSIILPYIQRTQRSHINANYFTIEAGVAAPDAGTNGLHPGAWDVTLNMGSSWLKTDLLNLERYFLPGNTLIVLNWDDTTAKNALTRVYTIVRAVNADAGGVAKAVVTLEPNLSAAGWAGAGVPVQATYQPTFGVAQTGVNSVSPREAWCYNQPANLTRKILVNWVQNVRYSRCTDSHYEKILNAIMTGKVNPYAQGFAYQNLADQNKQMAMLEEDAFLRTVFYGQRLNEFQEPETYDQLPVIYDRTDTTCPKEYKANALGFFTMLTDCQRVIDNNGAPLNLDYIFEQLYYLKRYREADGDKVQVIDSMTDRWTADKILQAMTKYYKVKYDIATERVAKIGEKIIHEGLLLFNYNLYDLPDIGVQWAVFHDSFFDDQISAFPSTVGAATDFKSRARALWFLDFSDMKIGIAGTMAVKRKTPDPETSELYKCVMVADQQEISLRNTKFTNLLDRPHRHLIIHNFSDACPLIAATSCPVPNPAP